ncbi:endoribonuclease Dicer-like protein 1-like [Iris pallida]|uniref:Endoribonuclease Dicer-like protein 1-like n=1 Tax=Iris pallida TaxID=29817 RepID=A0AAX6DHD3_IRIPA|nr:endoribonuclease Dicer-like protein 1-like [Iris pallida]
MYTVKSVNVGTSKDPFITQVSEYAVLFGSELDIEVLSMSMDLFVARTMIMKASLAFRGPIKITETQLVSLKSFHVRLMSIVLDVDVDPLTTPWDPAKAYLFVPVVVEKLPDPIQEIDWVMVDNIITTDAWTNPLQRARPDVFLGTNERTLGGDRREYGFGKLRNGMSFTQKVHPTYGVRGAVAQFDFVKASGLVPLRTATECISESGWNNDKLFMADSCIDVKELAGRIVTAAHSGKRFYVDSVRYDMNAENSFPRRRAT